MEFVYVVKRYDLFNMSFPHGFIPAEGSTDVPTWLERIRARGFFVERRHAEQDSSLKQIIPYCIVTSGDDVFLLRRFNTQGESRLHDKLSIGVGGHLNPIDGAGDVLDAGLARELEEELHVSCDWKAEAVGVINDESDDVGSVHFGVVHRIDLAEPTATVRETDKMGGEFITRGELLGMHAETPKRFESWSELILARFDEALRVTATS